MVAGRVHQLVDPGHVEGKRLDVDEGAPDVDDEGDADGGVGGGYGEASGCCSGADSYDDEIFYDILREMLGLFHWPKSLFTDNLKHR